MAARSVCSMASIACKACWGQSIVKQAHRKVHGLVWILLFPALLYFVYLAQSNGQSERPIVETAPHASAAGELP